MASLTIKQFGSPDERRNFTHGHMDVVKFGEGAVGRGVFEPGWRWSKDVKPIAGTKSCQASHAGYILSGKMHVVMDDGTEADLNPGEFVVIPPGHDAWTLGESACVMLDFTGAGDYARDRAGRGTQPPAH